MSVITDYEFNSVNITKTKIDLHMIWLQWMPSRSPADENFNWSKVWPTKENPTLIGQRVWGNRSRSPPPSIIAVASEAPGFLGTMAEIWLLHPHVLFPLTRITSSRHCTVQRTRSPGFVNRIIQAMWRLIVKWCIQRTPSKTLCSILNSYILVGLVRWWDYTDGALK